MESDKWPVDSHKPPCPYQSGFAVTIRRHVPPQPFGNWYSTQSMPRERLHPDDIPHTTQSDYCLRNPPIETPPLSRDKQETRRLVVTAEMASGDGRGAQVVRCSVGGDCNDKQPHSYVAKIYDSLYYAKDEESSPGHPAAGRWVEDWPFIADQDYSTEAAAYQESHEAGVDGELVPAYHGSWTFDLDHPASPGRPRPVRMILLEWVPDSRTMDQVDVEFVRTCIPPQHRLDIIAKALEVFSKLRFRGIKHEDIAPRNILLSMPMGLDITTQIPDMFLIDLNVSYVYSHPNCERIREVTEKPIDPGWEASWIDMNGFSDWLPRPHYYHTAALRAWLQSHWKDRTEFAEPPRQQRNQGIDDEAEYVVPQWDEDVEASMADSSSSAGSLDA